MFGKVKGYFLVLGKRKKMNCETRKRGKLCGKEECESCFSRSFASCDKAKYMVEGQGNPLLLARSSAKKFSFICPECEHGFEMQLNEVTRGYFCAFCSDRKLCFSEHCQACFEKSFASHKNAVFWCSSRNGKTPREVFANTHKKFWFNCRKCEHSFEMGLNSVSRGQFCPFCANQKLCRSDDCAKCHKKSFFGHKKAKFWDYSKNKESPREVFAGSNKKFWFNCGMCKHSFESVLGSILNGCFCPFCANKKLCSLTDCEMCHKKSFASHKKAEFWDFEKNIKTPREVFSTSHKKFWFGCGECKHSFESALSDVHSGCFCPFCGNQKLCALKTCEICPEKTFMKHKRAKYWDLEKNKKLPNEVFRGSHEKIWFKCKKGHNFHSQLQNVARGSWCPLCKNKTETKLLSFLKREFRDTSYQHKFSWCKNPETDRELPFDFCVSKTIIELDGKQHYEQVSNWQSPEVTQKNDRYKEECAIKNGYSVLRILQRDVWGDKIEWRKLLLEYIKDYETPIVKRLWE
ncbi:restriction endonuclease [Noumeavirus]|uniref:restriction endonuclease n=1 Tax=Noumeavirus TaxID=1955558 RepID=UPI000982BB7A|nr:restriction endonuclease [Noumeavirus]AQM73054.1 restriction endonuclease [Noumeavirus]